MTREYDAAVVGAGIVGLAHAYHLARRGMKVAVFERHARAAGASVRNFGMIWPIGQPPGPRLELAQRSRDLWRGVLREAGLWHADSGSLHAVYHDDEAAVLREFVARHGPAYGAELWTPAQVTARFPAVVAGGLKAGLWSPGEVVVDPRQVIADLPPWLSKTLAVDFFFDTAVIGYDLPSVRTTAGPVAARRLVIATGVDFKDLAPEAFAASGIAPCKLQMMRTSAYPGFRLGTMLAAGLTLRHYKAFADCPSVADVARRLDATMPDYGRFGIHVMAAQNGLGEIVLGDTHEYGDDIEPFDKAHLDGLVLSYLRTFVAIPDLTIAARWNGTYAKHPTEPWVVARPADGVVAVAGVGGAGMTLSFGLAERVAEEMS